MLSRSFITQILPHSLHSLEFLLEERAPVFSTPSCLPGFAAEKISVSSGKPSAALAAPARTRQCHPSASCPPPHSRFRPMTESPGSRGRRQSSPPGEEQGGAAQRPPSRRSHSWERRDAPGRAAGGRAAADSHHVTAQSLRATCGRQPRRHPRSSAPSHRAPQRSARQGLGGEGQPAASPRPPPLAAASAAPLPHPLPVRTKSAVCSASAH